MRVLIATAGMLAVALVTGTIEITASIPTNLSLTLAYLLFCFVAVSCLWIWRIATGAIFNPYGLWLLSVLAFSGGQIPLELLGLNPWGSLEFLAPTRILVETIVLVTWCVLAMQVGALLAVSPVIRATAGRIPPQVEIRGTTSVGYLLVAVSLVPFYFSARDAVSLVSEYGYTQLYRSPTVTSYAATPQILAELLIPGAMFILAGAAGRHWKVAASMGAILAYAAVHLFLGDRATAILPVVAWLWLYHRSVRPIPGNVLLLGVVASAVLFPAIAILRDLNSADRASLGLMGALASTPNPIAAVLAEMGGTMRTVAYTLELVPSVRPFDLGQSYGWALLTMVPNFTGGVHPAIAHGDYATWVTTTVDPISAAAGYSLGYSVIAEAYANFGWLAVLPCLAIGFGIGSLQSWSSAPGRYLAVRLAAVASYLPFILFWARSESLTIVRPLLWYALIPAAAVYAFDRISLKGSSPHREGGQARDKHVAQESPSAPVAQATLPR